ncbi:MULTISPECIES: 1,2-phenylacetyl-CoA epoxidase subunit PaaC [unclassified Isoptericola]|uniref:1,2-phenylacetyl-CoA epoxidase subunit PaaC n=1 Tax=unclassified Isoptericola TaxID=2623355 RepID=UPI0027135338|nr:MULTISPECIES: 1,2-phenylacetyl-CoA epoxidase subunit PaaC [unclassified Isoptericola]MDO8145402.1 1,2-phenylacetyl-CoA epoxidase subunit PaaC [Isoptericola sp. 178]MDO8149043.1 1,2-phenylacetyl-CoA epoxidase subunit PaaC [Isoptericola sp. b515]MDO8151017.1 1,2-phenylacetyl-CoA epoxidase subunit PaaC [Isoptericola sp. b408]
MSEHSGAHGDVSVDELTLAEELLGSGATATPPVAEYAMRLGDDALILSQQLGGWISRAPELEEDLALGNIALDLIGHARALLRYAGTASGRSEDDLAFWRDEPEFRSCWLVEQPNGHFGDTIARQFLFSAYQVELYHALATSTDPSLGAIAGKAEREVAYHLDHAAQWMLRLAGGTEESRGRITVSLGDLYPYVDELFEDDELTDRLAGVAPRPSSLRAGFDRTVASVLAEADLETPAVKPARGDGRRGGHTASMGYLLAEMQWLARRHPGATW